MPRAIKQHPIATLLTHHPLPFCLAHNTTVPHSPTPTNIVLHRQSRTLEISFDDGQQFHLSAEYLRVYSPSAEVMGHGANQRQVPLHKETVTINQVRPVGQYAVILVFDDGHDTGIYSWDTLYRLGTQYAQLWPAYLQEREALGCPHPAHPLTA